MYNCFCSFILFFIMFTFLPFRFSLFSISSVYLSSSSFLLCCLFSVSCIIFISVLFHSPFLQLPNLFLFFAALSLGIGNPLFVLGKCLIFFFHFISTLFHLYSSPYPFPSPYTPLYIPLCSSNHQSPLCCLPFDPAILLSHLHY